MRRLPRVPAGDPRIDARVERNFASETLVLCSHGVQGEKGVFIALPPFKNSRDHFSWEGARVGLSLSDIAVERIAENFHERMGSYCEPILSCRI